MTVQQHQAKADLSSFQIQEECHRFLCKVLPFLTVYSDTPISAVTFFIDQLWDISEINSTFSAMVRAD
jgi:hypothetical protein